VKKYSTIDYKVRKMPNLDSERTNSKGSKGGPKIDGSFKRAEYQAFNFKVHHQKLQKVRPNIQKEVSYEGEDKL
jgi:hypothetical protein